MIVFWFLVWTSELHGLCLKHQILTRRNSFRWCSIFLFRNINMAELRWLIAVAKQWMLLLCPENIKNIIVTKGLQRRCVQSQAMNEFSIIHSGSKVKSKSSMLMENKGKSNNQKQTLLPALINISYQPLIILQSRLKDKRFGSKGRRPRVTVIVHTSWGYL